MAEYDAIIVGAGILGLTTAYHIQRVRPEDKILLVDKYSTAGQGNTAKSAAMFRCFFHSEKNFFLTDSSVEFYKTIQKTCGIDIKIRWSGYLWLFSEEDYRWVRPLLNQMAKKNVQFSVYDEETLADRLNIRTQVEEDEDSKLMGLVNVHKGVFIPKAGSLDVDALVKFYETKFLQYGGKIKYNTNVENLLVEPHTSLGISGEPYFWQESEVVGVRTEFGSLKAKKVIVAAGAWANSILDPVGIDAHIKPLKRQLFIVKAQTVGLKSLLWTKGFNREGCIPFTILPKPRVYMKPAVEEDSLWLCYGDEFPREFKLEDDPQPEESFYRYGIYQVVTKYFSQFLGSQPASSFAGLYAVNTLDGQPVVFKKNNLVTVGGASGSGIMKADALGRVAAALYLGEEYAPLHGDCKLKVSDLSIEKRSVEMEKLVI